jgi:2-iminobutanoate/2-iminopropanoate deaminase
MMKLFLITSYLLIGFSILSSCNHPDNSVATVGKESTGTQKDTLEYFNLRPKVEKEYGYTHAVKIGDDLKISGAVSMDDNGILIAEGDMDQ